MHLLQPWSNEIWSSFVCPATGKFVTHAPTMINQLYNVLHDMSSSEWYVVFLLMVLEQDFLGWWSKQTCCLLLAATTRWQQKFKIKNVLKGCYIPKKIRDMNKISEHVPRAWGSRYKDELQNFTCSCISSWMDLFYILTNNITDLFNCHWIDKLTPICMFLQLVYSFLYDS